VWHCRGEAVRAKSCPSEIAREENLEWRLAAEGKQEEGLSGGVGACAKKRYNQGTDPSQSPILGDLIFFLQITDTYELIIDPKRSGRFVLFGSIDRVTEKRVGDRVCDRSEKRRRDPSMGSCSVCSFSNQRFLLVFFSVDQDGARSTWRASSFVPDE
jgi:hypothetical protein